MPGYKVHDALTVGVSGFGIVVGSVRPEWWGAALVFATTNAISGLLLSPDLDTYSRIYLRWGWLRWMWIPYQYLVPHRHWLSHSPWWSIWIRAGYLIFLLAGIGWIMDWGMNTSLVATAMAYIQHGWRLLGPTGLWAGAGGLVAGSATHVYADRYTSSLKRKRRSSSRPR